MALDDFGYESNSKSIGIKFDTGKPRFDLIDPEWELEVVKGLTHGATLHGDHNWQQVAAKRFHAALRRHLNAHMRGEVIDKDTGLSHLALASCNLMFLHYMEVQKI